MTKPRLISKSPTQPASSRGQMSHANLLDGRGRSRAAHRRAHVWLSDPMGYRAAFPERWSVLVRHLFRSREALAADFGVTFQTACNWWDGTCRPSGDVVARAALTWPEDFARIVGA